MNKSIDEIYGVENESLIEQEHIIDLENISENNEYNEIIELDNVNLKV